MMKKLIAMLLCAVLLAGTFGCAAAGESSLPGSSAAQSGNAQSGSEAQAFPVTVADAAGRAVTVEAEPQRIVSGYYITTSMMIALGQRDKLVGIEAKAASRPIYALAAPELLDLPSVGTAKEFDLEGCAALQPDLVVLPMKLKDAAATLEELGMTVLLVNPEDLEQLEETIRMLGDATGAADRAQALLESNAQAQRELAELLAGAEKPQVYLAGNHSRLSTAGARMYQNTLIELGGGVNVAAGLEDDYWAEVSYEQLLAWDPQVIVMVPEAGYTREDILNDENLAGVDAVKNGRVYAMPSAFEAWDSPVPGAQLGSRWMAAVLHGEAYPFEDFCDDAAAFYSEFYGVGIDKTLLTK